MRDRLLSALGAAIAAADPAKAVRGAMKRNGRVVTAAGGETEVSGVIRVVAVGKAAAGMAIGAHEVLGDMIAEGLVVGPDPDDAPPPFVSMAGSHPTPDPSSLTAGEAAFSIARKTNEHDLLVCLVSGGGSALAELPRREVDLADLVSVQREMGKAGAPIHELNLVRRHLSDIKNGGLAAAAHKGSILTLLLSDVADNPPSTIASGPTLRDSSTPRQALATLRARLGAGIPATIEAALDRDAPPSASIRHRWTVVADGSTAGRAAAAWLEDRGTPARVADTPLAGEAASCAFDLMSRGRPGVIVLTGETTVTGANRGKGGRNQEAALAAAIAGAEQHGWMFAALGTDGIDGPTDAAGAIVDGGSVARGQSEGEDAAAALASHDSYTFLRASGDLIRTGPTGTNVGDIWMLARE